MVIGPRAFDLVDCHKVNPPERFEEVPVRIFRPIPEGVSVANVVEKQLALTSDTLLLRQVLQRPSFSPHPALIRILTGHNDAVRSVCCSTNGRLGISASNDDTLRVWDLETGECKKTLNGHTAWVLGVCCTPDGRLAVSASWDQTLRVWDLETGECKKTLKGHTWQVWAVCCTPDGRLAVSASWIDFAGLGFRDW